MKISTKGRYGTRAAFELAMQYGTGPVMVREIAERQNISERYLEQILNTLRTSDLVRSTRGAHGGYELSHEPSTITVGDIVRSLEGTFDVVPCTGEEHCGMMEKCITSVVWKNVKTAIESVLDAVTLEDLVKQYRTRLNNNVVEYHI